jgi:hypothetical protein
MLVRPNFHRVLSTYYTRNFYFNLLIFKYIYTYLSMFHTPETQSLSRFTFLLDDCQAGYLEINRIFTE